MRNLTKTFILRWIFIALFTAKALAYFAPTKYAHFFGDANGDLAITPADLTIHQNRINGKAVSYDTLQPKTPADRWNTCDINHDRACTSDDLNLMRAYLIGAPVDLGADDPWGIATNLAGFQQPQQVINFQAGLYATVSGAKVGIPGISIEVRIDSANSTTTGYLTGRSCDGGVGDVPTLAGAQCAIGVTITQWGSDGEYGWTELSPLPLGIYADGGGVIELDFEVAGNPALDIPQVTFSQQIVFLATLPTNMISVDGNHSCALTATGGVKCWGWNQYGQLGDGTTISRYVPANVSGLTSGVIGISAGGYHTCALMSGGGVKCWGLNSSGQLGAGTTNQSTTPVDVLGLTDVKAISAGRNHTCALTNSGGVKCWGWNTAGQLGDGTNTNKTTPVDVLGLTSGVIAISAGDMHTCAVTQTGGVKCWGSNYIGQLGDGTYTDRNTPVNVSGLSSGVSAVAGGYQHTCALMNSGGVKCWGYNEFGQLGDGTFVTRLTPIDVLGLSSGVSAITTGYYHTCALMNTGEAKCWGKNEFGQVGDGTATDRFTAVDVSGLSSGVLAISGGGKHTCALLNSGEVKCWGNNENGQVGVTTSAISTTPVDVYGLSSGVVALSAGGRHTCVITGALGGKCWGYDYDGALGNGTLGSSPTPVDVSDFSAGEGIISAGYGHTCGATDIGSIKCWGWNQYGQLGDGSSTSKQTPVTVTGMPANYFSAGYAHTCGISSTNGVKCWGWNIYGQLGDGTTLNRYTPVDVSGLTDVVMISAGYYHTCALLVSGGVKCWGWNANGQLGDGTTTTRTTPVDVVGLSSGVVAISAGGYHTCAQMSGTGAVKCWGNNMYGQLGDGTTTNRYTPVDVVGLTSSYSFVSTGLYHTCVPTDTGIKCWGWNQYGQLGDGTTINRYTPVDVYGITTPGIISTRSNHTCAHLNTGEVKCWGDNAYGQLGNGEVSAYHTTAVAVQGLSLW